ncbi:hypothetical protein PAMA_022055 [Pampus argenteus]
MPDTIEEEGEIATQQGQESPKQQRTPRGRKTKSVGGVTDQEILEILVELAQEAQMGSPQQPRRSSSQEVSLLDAGEDVQSDPSPAITPNIRAPTQGPCAHVRQVTVDVHHNQSFQDESLMSGGDSALDTIEEEGEIATQQGQESPKQQRTPRGRKTKSVGGVTDQEILEILVELAQEAQMGSPQQPRRSSSQEVSLLDAGEDVQSDPSPAITPNIRAPTQGPCAHVRQVTVDVHHNQSFQDESLMSGGDSALDTIEEEGEIATQQGQESPKQQRTPRGRKTKSVGGVTDQEILEILVELAQEAQMGSPQQPRRSSSQEVSLLDAGEDVQSDPSPAITPNIRAPTQGPCAHEQANLKKV